MSQGVKSVDMVGKEGINRAFDEWMAQNSFKLIYECRFNHGLRVYKAPSFNLYGL
jgi:hypothetical protein